LLDDAVADRIEAEQSAEIRAAIDEARAAVAGRPTFGVNKAGSR
jgi:hypothetical protein